MDRGKSIQTCLEGKVKVGCDLSHRMYITIAIERLQPPDSSSFCYPFLGHLDSEGRGTHRISQTDTSSTHQSPQNTDPPHALLLTAFRKESQSFVAPVLALGRLSCSMLTAMALARRLRDRDQPMVRWLLSGVNSTGCEV